MKKRIFALLTALCCMSAIVSAPVSAVIVGNEEGFVEGSIVDKSTKRFCGVMIETDGTELTEEVASGFEDFHSLETYEEFARDYCWGKVITNITPDGTAFMFCTQYSDTDALTKLGREIMTELDYVTDVHIVDEVTYQQVELMYGYAFATLNPDDDVNETVYPELKEFTVYGSNGTYTAKIPDETVMGLREQYTDYEQYLMFVEFADSMMEKYRDTLRYFSPEIIGLESGSADNGNYIATSVWTSAGDNNSDGNVTAEDAAGMLTLAAQIGTGADIKATSANDVNSDGTVNAEDAAAVLAYAAANGSGNEVSWVDILRR